MELRICPVCGSHSVSRFKEGLAREDANEEIYFVDMPVDHCIVCPYCGHSAYSRSWEEVEKLWNTEKPSQWELDRWAKRNRHEGTTT